MLHRGGSERICACMTEVGGWEGGVVWDGRDWAERD